MNSIRLRLLKWLQQARTELAEQKAGYAAYLDSFETTGGHR